MTEQVLSPELIAHHCVDFLSGQLNVAAADIDINADYDSLGMDSVMAVSLILNLEEWSGTELEPSLLFDHPNLYSLSKYIAHIADLNTGAELTASEEAQEQGRTV